MPSNKKKKISFSSKNSSLGHEAILPKFSSFDPTGLFYAAVIPNIASLHLKVWNCTTSSLISELSIGDRDECGGDSTFSALSWGSSSTPQIATADLQSTNQHHAGPLLFVGLSNGDIWLYSPIEGLVRKKIKGAHQSAVNSITPSIDGSKCYSCGQDQMIACWDISDGKILKRWNPENKSLWKIVAFSTPTTSDLSKSSLQKEFLLVASQSIFLFDVTTGEKIKSFSGHAANVSFLSVHTNQHKSSNAFPVAVSCGENDRFFMIWDLLGQESSLVTSLSVESNSCREAFWLSEERRGKGKSSRSISKPIALSEEGVIYFWDNFSTSTSTSTTNKPISISFINSKGNLIPIIQMVPLFSIDTLSVMTARGSILMPYFEKIDLLATIQQQPSTNEIKLKRKFGSAAIGNLLTPTTSSLTVDDLNDNNPSAQSASNTDDIAKAPALVTGISDQEIVRPKMTPSGGNNLRERLLNDDSFEAKLKKLQLNQQINSADQRPLSTKESINSSNKKNEGATNDLQGNFIPKASSLITMLLQALKSKDRHLLEDVLRVSDVEIIENTTRKLPAPSLIPFLHEIVTRFQTNPNRGYHLMGWIKAILVIHVGYLVTVPELAREISFLYQTIEERLASFNTLLSLNGKLELAVAQIAAKSKVSAEDNVSARENPLLIMGEDDVEVHLSSDVENSNDQDREDESDEGTDNESEEEKESESESEKEEQNSNYSSISNSENEYEDAHPYNSTSVNNATGSDSDE